MQINSEAEINPMTGRKALTDASGRSLDGAPPPRFLTHHRGGDGAGQSEAGVALVGGPRSQGEVLAQDAAVDGRQRHSAGHD